MALTYTSLADLDSYYDSVGRDLVLPGDTTYVTRLLETCERDVDRELRLLTGTTRNATTGLKIDPADLTAWQANRLSRAVCAQYLYRTQQTPEFFSRPQYDETRGPDFSTKGRLQRVSPDVYDELDGTGLLRVSGIGSISMAAYSDEYPWLVS
jgi:hypothetical protein